MNVIGLLLIILGITSMLLCMFDCTPTKIDWANEKQIGYIVALQSLVFSSGLVLAYSSYCSSFCKIILRLFLPY